MSFNSLYFILMFLPVTLPAYYAAARRSAAAADWILVGAAVVFYGFTNAWYPVMLGVLLSVNWGITLQIRRAQSGTATGAAAGTAGKGVFSRTEEEKTAEDRVSQSGTATGAAAGTAGKGVPSRTKEEKTAENRASQSGAAGEKTAGEKTAGEKTAGEKTAPSGGNAARGKTAEKKTAQAGGGGAGRAWMIAGIAGNVAVLAVFKYTNFFIGNLNALFGSDRALVDLILPLGISFIIFGQIAWIVDSFRGSTADVSLREYVVYASFFPKLSQGPITLPRDFLPQIRKEGRQCFDYERMMAGIQMFVCGLAKKLFLADTLGTAVDWYYDTMQFRSNVDTVIVLLTYTLQIYCDFSGYSDMALGVSKMLGFDLPANFDSPYRACSVTEFWKRWHISLTTFLREYIYFPLGGSRKGSARTYRNIMVVYLVSGFWHGASWTYVLWGVVHGLAQCAERLLGRFWHGVLEPAAAKIRSAGRDAGAEKIRSLGRDAWAGDSESGTREDVSGRFLSGEQKTGAGRFCHLVWKGVRWAVTFVFVNLAWMIFRSGDLSTLRRVWWHLTVDRTGTISPDLAENYRISGLRLVCSLVHLPTGDVFVNLLSMGLVLGFCLFLCLCLPNNQKRQYRSSALSLAVTVVLLAVCLLSMSSVSTFVYNDF